MEEFRARGPPAGERSFRTVHRTASAEQCSQRTGKTPRGERTHRAGEGGRPHGGAEGTHRTAGSQCRRGTGTYRSRTGGTGCSSCRWEGCCRHCAGAPAGVRHGASPGAPAAAS
eukprot:151872_1